MFGSLSTTGGGSVDSVAEALVSLLKLIDDPKAAQAYLGQLRAHLRDIEDTKAEFQALEKAHATRMADSSRALADREAAVKKREDALASMQALSADLDKRVIAIEAAHAELTKRKTELDRLAEHHAETTRHIEERDSDSSKRAQRLFARENELEALEKDYAQRMAKLREITG